MNRPKAILRTAPALNGGELATIEIQAGRSGIAISPMRSLLTDHNLKRLAP